MNIPLNNHSKQMIFKLQEENPDKKRKAKSLTHQTIFAKVYLKASDATESLYSSPMMYRQTLERVLHKHRAVDWTAHKLEDCVTAHTFDEVPFPSKYALSVTGDSKKKSEKPKGDGK